MTPLSPPAPSGYEILETLHRSERTTVFRARHQASDEQVILKCLASYRSPARATLYFRHEFDVGRHLSGDEFIDLYRLERHGRHLVIVEQDIGATSLDQILEERRFDVEEFLSLALRIVDAVEAMHRQEIVHRDLNPSNIIWNPDTDQLKLIDFGLAVRSRELRSSTGAIAEETRGTLPYISPEQTGRSSRVLDYRTDYYSLGVTLYELLVGRRPFEATSPAALVHAHLARRPIPSHRQRPDLPHQLSLILDKLLAKAPEDRYQSARGLRTDLQRCRDEFSATGTISDFDVGTRDVRTSLQVSKRLYGRQRELTELQRSVRRIHHGGRQMRLVSGTAGIGKSTLVEHLQAPVLSGGGWFVASKFDAPRDAAPFSGLADAFGKLFTRLLGEEAQALADWRQRLRKALGDDEPLVSRLIPELAIFLGGSSSSRSPRPTEATHRFRRAVHRLVGLLAERSHPLTLVLDDLHWADDATLRLLESLLADETLDYLLVIGTYRPEAIDDSHPLMQMCRRLDDREIVVETTELGPLDDDAVARLVADSLDTDVESTWPLTELVIRKTSNNPYFIDQFLNSLAHDNLLGYDHTRDRWTWDQHDIATLPVTDNVVDMLQGRIGRLPEQTRRLLIDASFLGNQFRLTELAAVQHREPIDVSEALEPALDQDILFRASEPELLDPDDPTSPAITEHLSFPHDQIREAIQQLVAPDDAPAIHLRIGRRLQPLAEEHDSDRLLFSVVRNLDDGRQLIDDFEQRRHLIELNVRAAARATALQAIPDATRYLEIADDLVDDLWDRDFDLAQTVAFERTRVAILDGRFELAEQLVDTALEHLDDPVERAEFHRLSIRRLVLVPDIDAAIDHGRRALDELGYQLPTTDLADAATEAFDRLEEIVDGRPIEELAEISSAGEPTAEATLEILAELQPAAGLWDFQLLLVVGLEATALTVSTGIRPESLVGFAIYGTALCVRGHPRRGRQAGQLALELARQFDRQFILSHVAFIHAAMISPWSRPLDESLVLLEESHQTGIRSGNYAFAGFSLSLLALYNLHLGRNLDDVRKITDRAIRFGRDVQHLTAVDLATAVRRTIEQLVDDRSTGDVDDDRLGDDEFIEQCYRHGADSAAVLFRLLRAQLDIIYGRFEPAVEQLTELTDELEPLVGTFDTARHPFYLAIALAGFILDDPENRSPARRETLEQLRGVIASLADDSPSNFDDKLALIDAELARLDDDVERALDCYDRAIENARSRDFIHIEALATERAARFWLEHEERRDFAALRFRQAREAYEIWGADQKVAAIDDLYGRLFTFPTTIDSTSGTSTSSGDTIDLESVFKASEAIASSVDLEHLLPTLMEVTLENAGAQRGTFLIVDDGDLAVAVEGHVDDEPIRHDPPLSLDDWYGPRSIARYVHRTRNPLFRGRAHRDLRFRGDPYFEETRPRSIACIPAEEHGEIRGILYVENNLADDVFTEDRIRLLEVLAGHIAIALNKARLYAELREKKERFRQLAENIREVFWLMDWNDRRIVYVSPAYETIWGRPRPSLPTSIEDWVGSIVSDDRAMVEDKLRDDAGAGEYDVTYRIERPSGAERWVHDRGFPIRDADGEVQRIAGIARDVTRPRELARMKDEFISIVSHELRTPLTPITGIFSMLNREYHDEIPDEVQKMTELGLRNSRRLLTLIDDLLDIQRLSMDRIDFNFETLDLRTIISDAVELNDPLGDPRKIRFSYTPPTSPLWVNTDLNRLMQVVTNLLSNAVKFSDEGDSIEIETRRCDGRVRLSITDHGPGIPPEVRQRVFEKFTQADTTMTRKHGGIGLGLAISRALVERLGGTIDFDTKLGEGTTFFVELPLAEAPDYSGDQKDRDPDSGARRSSR